ncbi:threonine efflux protein [Alcanivorax hongdengensis A-11-3]|uniref:Threonine efflux protein n=1 Tax=Alcanivorax hongdengensis A-11-3 TaxID=1177179 RepID=L0WIS2_9GAMM|nr:LysE family translocator [Alcanivorax hongdengensis]EKF76067.1 threonine efflux protein [Alcanivorax hongdengensis A-11-3]
MSLTDCLLLVGIMLPLAAMPSTSVALVVTRSATAGRRQGVRVTAGIVCADLLFVMLALLGMTMLAGLLGAFFTAVKYLAGAYLIWLGICLLRQSRASTSAGQHPAGDFLAGLLVTLGDIKAIFFYASLLPTLVDLTRLTATDIFIILALTTLTVGGVKLGYVWAASRLHDRLAARLTSAPRRLGGGLMIGCGSVLILKA